MKNRLSQIFAVLLILTLLIITYQYNRLSKPPYVVVDAQRIDDCIHNCNYRVGLVDRKGNYFALELDIVEFAAMGINTNDILILGEL